jgi:hypothetical protein
MERTVGKILRTSYPKLSQSQRMPLRIHRAAQQLSACRTSAMGGHIQGCPEGHASRVVFHSCKHRLCPQCNTLPTERWLLKMKERLLDCSHHHIIFTIPHDLNELWCYNRAWMMQALFSTAADTLKTLCKDPTHLDAMPGFILSLHTWGRTLQLHPHIHCLISHGGMREGQWHAPKGSYFLPGAVVMALFRGKLLAVLRTALEEKALCLPPDLSIERGRSLLNKLGRKKWNVYFCERYEHGQGVLVYLARYVRGGPLKNSQLTEVSDDHVTFRYRSHRKGEPKIQYLRLERQAFSLRYLQHTPLPHKPIVRHYGLYANRHETRLNQARAAHEQLPVQEPMPLTWQAHYERRAKAPTPITHCAHCGQPLLRLSTLPKEPIAKQQAPP